MRLWVLALVQSSAVYSLGAIAPTPAIAQSLTPETSPVVTAIATSDDPLATAPTTSTPNPDRSPADVFLEQPPLQVAQAQPITGLQVLGATDELRRVIEELIQSEVGQPVDPTQLQADVAAIRATGWFSQASVTQVAAPGGVNVVFQVEPVIVRSLTVTGAEVLPDAVVDEIFAAQINQPISPIDLEIAIAAINSWYAENGYVLASATGLSPSPDGTIAISVAEGIVESLTFQFVEDGETADEDGNPIEGRTRTSFLEQETALEVGQPFRESVVRRDVQNLARLDLFDSVDVLLQGDSEGVEVIYNLEESPPRSFNLGGGVGGRDGLYGSVTYSDRNVGGVGQRLEGELRISELDVQFEAGFVSPYRQGVPDRLGYSIQGSRRRFFSPTFTDEVEFANGDRIQEGRFGGGVTLSRGFGDWIATAGANYTRISLRDSDGDITPVDARGNQLSVSGTGADDLATVSLRLAQDLRNNPTVTRSGSLLAFSTTQSVPVGLGDIAFNQLQANYVQYYPVSLLGGGDLEKNPEAFVFNLQGGTSIGEVPPYEAFNLGGGNSVRGYGGGDVGTGRNYILASAEYRFPLFRPVGGVLFADFATDLGSGDTILGEPGPERDKPGSGLGFGLGLRVPSFLGLLRADFGFNDQGGNAFFFGIGQRY